jgi:integrase
MTMLGLTFLNDIIESKGITNPSEILNLLRDKIINTLKQTGKIGDSKDGMDITLCCINKNNNELHFAAANNPLYIVKNPGKTKKAREALGKASAKKDVLQKGQLKTWFTAIQKIQNPAIASCLQVLLLSGARLNEVLTMKWEDVNTQWKSIKIKDKVEEAREIPLTPYIEHLITSLPRRNEYVFAISTCPNA